MHYATKPSHPFSHISETWYKISAPPAPSPDAPLLIKEVSRRGRIISLAMLISIILLLFVFIVVPSFQFVFILLVVFLTDVIAVFFNRRGKILVAGMIISIVNELGLLATLLAQLMLNRGVDVQTALFLPVLAQTVMITVSTLPTIFAILNLLLNSAVVLVTLTFVPYAPSLQTYLHNGPITPSFLYYGPLVLIIQTTIISIIWVRSANKAIIEADRADAQIHYEQMMTLQAEGMRAKLKQDVNEITRLLAQIENDPTQEIQIDQRQNNLWMLASSLNLLRRRLVSAYREISYLQQLKTPETASHQACSSFTIDFSLMSEEDRRRYQQAALQFLMAMNSQKKQTWQATGTALDDIAYLHSYQSQG